jgi:hypothetical protein
MRWPSERGELAMLESTATNRTTVVHAKPVGQSRRDAIRFSFGAVHYSNIRGKWPTRLSGVAVAGVHLLRTVCRTSGRTIELGAVGGPPMTGAADTQRLQMARCNFSRPTATIVRGSSTTPVGGICRRGCASSVISFAPPMPIPETDVPNPMRDTLKGRLMTYRVVQ